MNLILASKSPRRKEILSKLGYTFCVIPALKDEVFKGQDIDAALKNVALSKVKEVFEKHNNDCIIGADTIVVYDGQILQKRRDYRFRSAELEGQKRIVRLFQRIHQEIQ